MSGILLLAEKSKVLHPKWGSPRPILHCPECGKPFQSHDARAMYCSISCGARGKFVPMSSHSYGPRRPDPPRRYTQVPPEPDLSNLDKSKAPGIAPRGRWHGRLRRDDGNRLTGPDTSHRPEVFPVRQRPELVKAGEEGVTALRDEGGEGQHSGNCSMNTKSRRGSRGRALGLATLAARDAARCVARRAKRDNYICYICGAHLNPALRVPNPLAATLDHVIPLAKGGGHTKDNAKTACFRCNCIKSDRISA